MTSEDLADSLYGLQAGCRMGLGKNRQILRGSILYHTYLSQLFHRSYLVTILGVSENSRTHKFSLFPLYFRLLIGENLNYNKTSCLFLVYIGWLMKH